MKICLSTLALALLGFAGCTWTLPSLKEEEKAPPVVGAARQPARPRALVAPEQVNEKNAREKAMKLRDELDWAEQDSAEVETIP